MKKLILISLLSFLSLFLFSQQITPQALVSAGDFFEGTNVSISWSLGDIAIETITENTIILTQGFQQPSINITSIQEVKHDRIGISVYPNPTVALVNVKIDNPEGIKIIIEITDPTGRIIRNKRIIENSMIEEINIQDFVSGLYIVRAWSTDKTYMQTVLIHKISK